MTRSSSDASASDRRPLAPRVIRARDAGTSDPPYRGRVFRPMLRAQVITDLLIAVLLGGLVLVASGRGLDGPLSVVTVVGMTGALAIRRLSPGLALAVAWVFAVFEMVTLQVPDVSNAFIAGVMYTTSAYGSRRVRLAGLVSAILGSVAAAAYMGFDDYQNRLTYETASTPLQESLQVTLSFFAVVLLLLLLPWLAGLVVRTRRSASMSREAQLLAERDAARADRAVAVEQERMRIARDMHDIVAHSLAVVIAQADGARYALKADPAAAEEALGTISATARVPSPTCAYCSAQLRHEQGTAPTPDDRRPRPARRPDARSSGSTCGVEREGDPAGLPHHHAARRLPDRAGEPDERATSTDEPGSPVRAALTYRPDTVEIAVVNRRADDGRPRTRHGPRSGRHARARRC